MQIKRSIKERVAIWSTLVGLIFGFALLALFWVVGVIMREPYEPKCVVPSSVAFYISVWFGAICGASVWFVYFMLRWIALGFRSDTKKE